MHSDHGRGHMQRHRKADRLACIQDFASPHETFSLAHTIAGWLLDESRVVRLRANSAITSCNAHVNEKTTFAAAFCIKIDVTLPHQHSDAPCKQASRLQHCSPHQNLSETITALRALLGPALEIRRQWRCGQRFLSASARGKALFAERTALSFGRTSIDLAGPQELPHRSSAPPASQMPREDRRRPRQPNSFRAPIDLHSMLRTGSIQI